MAKRKVKKCPLKNVGLVIGCLALLFAVLGIVLFLALDSSILYVADNGIADSAVNGFRVAFGYKETIEILGSKTTTTLLNPSAGIIIALILAVVGGVLAMPKNKILNLAGGVALVVAAVLFALAGNLTGITEEVKKLYGALGDLVSVGYKSAVGAYLGCGFSAVAGLVSVTRAVLKK